MAHGGDKSSRRRKTLVRIGGKRLGEYRVEAGGQGRIESGEQGRLAVEVAEQHILG